MQAIVSRSRQSAPKMIEQKKGRTCYMETCAQKHAKYNRARREFLFYLPAVDLPKCQLRRINYKCITKPQHPLRGRAGTRIKTKSPTQVDFFIVCSTRTLSKALIVALGGETARGVLWVCV